MKSITKSILTFGLLGITVFSMDSIEREAPIGVGMIYIAKDDDRYFAYIATGTIKGDLMGMGEISPYNLLFDGNGNLMDVRLGDTWMWKRGCRE